MAGLGTTNVIAVELGVSVSLIEIVGAGITKVIAIGTGATA